MKKWTIFTGLAVFLGISLIACGRRDEQVREKNRTDRALEEEEDEDTLREEASDETDKASDTEPEEDGGTVDKSDPDAPKTLPEGQLVSFSLWFSTLDNPEPGALGAHIRELSARLENGAVKGEYQVRDTKESWSFRADHSLMNKALELCEQYDIGRFNGHYIEVSGLPEDYGVFLELRFSSGETVSVRDNQENVLPVSFLKAAVELFESAAANPPVLSDPPEEYEKRYGLSKGIIARSDSEVLSFYQETDLGDGKSFIQTHNLGTASGEELGFSDVFSDMEYLPSLLLLEFGRAYPELKLYDNALEIIKKSVENGDGDICFALSYGFAHIFANGGVLCEGTSCLHATLSYFLNPSQVRAFYTTSPRRYVLPLEEDADYYREDMSSGFRLHSTFSETDADEVLWEVYTDGNRENSAYSESFYGYPPDCYLVHVNGKDFIYLDVPAGDVSMATMIFEVAQGRVFKKTFEPLPLSVQPDTSLNPDALSMSMDRLIYSESAILLPYAEYKVGTDGLPEQTGSIFYLEGPWVRLREGGRYNPPDPSDAAVSGGMWTLIQGERLRPYRTDMESFLDFVTEDERIVRFSIDKYEDDMQLDNFGTLDDVFMPDTE